MKISEFLEIEGASIRGTKDGLEICGTVSIGGISYPVCVPKRLTQWDDIRREAKNAGQAIESWWKRLFGKKGSK